MEPLGQQLMIVACLRSVQIFLALNLTGISWDDLNIELAIIYWLRLGLQPLTKTSERSTCRCRCRRRRRSTTMDPLHIFNDRLRGNKNAAIIIYYLLFIIIYRLPKRTMEFLQRKQRLV